MATKAKKTRPQLNLTPRVALLERLGELAKSLKGDEKFRNEVALEMLETIEPYWERIKRAQEKIVEVGVEAIERGAVEVAVDEFTPEQSESVTARKSPKK